MARINVDDKWFIKDQRRKDFAKAVGNEYEADGIALQFWLVGQEAHARGKLVNKKMFMRMPHAKEFLACELAEERDGGIYIKGSKRRAKFLAERVEAGHRGGTKRTTAKAQAAKLREQRKRAQRNAASVTIEEKHEQPQANSTKHEPHSHSHSHSHSLPQSQDQTITLPSVTCTPPAVVARKNPVAVYCEAYKARYGHNPQIGQKQAGILTRFAKSHGPKADLLINGFFAMPSPFLVERSHPVELLEAKLNEIVRFLATGKVVTKGAVKEFEEKLEDHMGPKPKGIKEALAEAEELKRKAMALESKELVVKRTTL